MARKAAEQPNLTCPFTGRPIEIRQLAGGLYWQGRVETPDGGYNTSLFETKEELVYFLSTRGGVLPKFQKRTRITVRHLDPPAPSPVADLVEKGKVLDEMGAEFAGRVLAGR